MENWDEIRTAYHVARLGTVSGAAEVLGVHHATVIRHIDALERRLGTRLFQRHARGYTPTEAGRDLLHVAQATEDQFIQLAGRIKGQAEAVGGELIVTAVQGLGDILVPSLVRFQAAHPGLLVRYMADNRLYRLEYGEAHVAVRAGTVPDQPDNVVQPFLHHRYALYATQAYAAQHGLPADEHSLAGHRYIGPDPELSRAPFHRWLAARVPAGDIAFRSSESHVLEQAVLAGAGIGFLPRCVAERQEGLVEVLPDAAFEEWVAPIWLVTHVDLHRTTKVQAFLNFLKAEAKTWPKV